jgi:hypothetical protein
MTTHKIVLSSGTLAAAALIAMTAFPAAAQTLSASVSANASAAGVSAGASASAKLSTIISKADSAIAARINALNALNTRVAGMKNESATEKANISSQVQTNITGLTSLKAKIDADTDASVAKTDAASIFGTFRIYALVIPQGWILASADRVTTIGSMMTSLGAKIQTRITADQSAGKNVASLTAALSDMNAKVTDANSQSATASAGISGLTPDQGNASVAASNKAALVASRADIKTATADLKAARQDITTLLSGLKSLGSVSASASASTAVSSQ